jgi:chromosome partitioning protein
VATVVSFVSEKGGVGKTTACYHIAVALKRYHGKNVLVIDADYQRGGITGRFFPQLIENFTTGTISGQTLFHKYQQLYSAGQQTPEVTILNANYEDVHVIVADKRLANVSVDKLPSTNNIRDNNIALLHHLQITDYVITNVANGYDYVLIDSHPELSDVLRSIIYASDYCVSPVKLDLQSAIGVPSVIAEINTVNADTLLMQRTIAPNLQYKPTIFAGARVQYHPSEDHDYALQTQVVRLISRFVMLSISE